MTIYVTTINEFQLLLQSFKHHCNHAHIDPTSMKQLYNDCEALRQAAWSEGVKLEGTEIYIPVEDIFSIYHTMCMHGMAKQGQIMLDLNEKLQSYIGNLENTEKNIQIFVSLYLMDTKGLKNKNRFANLWIHSIGNPALLASIITQTKKIIPATTKRLADYRESMQEKMDAHYKILMATQPLVVPISTEVEPMEIVEQEFMKQAKEAETVSISEPLQKLLEFLCLSLTPDPESQEQVYSYIEKINNEDVLCDAIAYEETRLTAMTDEHQKLSVQAGIAILCARLSYLEVANNLKEKDKAANKFYMNTKPGKSVENIFNLSLSFFNKATITPDISSKTSKATLQPSLGSS